MADPDTTKLVVLPFLQHWDATSKQLSLRVLLIPRDSFIVPFVPSSLTSPKFFPNASLKFNVRVLSGLHDGLPEPGSGTVTDAITLPPPASAVAVFKSLVDTLGNKINPSPTSRARLKNEAAKSVRKHLPESYRHATGYTPSPRGDGMFSTDNTYSCAMKQVRPKPYIKREQKLYGPSWGEIIASILRIPDFAALAGFIRTQTVKIPAESLADGAFVWLELDPASAAAIDVSASSTVKTYASRLLPTTKTADLFTPLLFPVIKASDLPSGIAYDDIYREHSDYADGWAKTVHCTQQQNTAMVTESPSSTSRPVKDIGIRLGWDDETVTIWADRALNPASLQTGYDNFPLGVHGYRVDVLDPVLNAWVSLCSAGGEFGIGTTAFGRIAGELGVEVHPVLSLDVEEDRVYWMPMYFTNWAQTSLVGPDERTLKLLGRYRPPSGITPPGFPIQGNVDARLALRYGRKYQFRVRLMDHTGGGPTLASPTGSLGQSPVASMTFRRWIKPLAPQLVGAIPALENKPGAETPVDFIEVKRPLMFYPAVMFANYTYNGQDAATELVKMADAINANPPASGERVTEPGLPDPDVNRVEVTVFVQTIAQDPLATEAGFMPLYTTTRLLPADLKASGRIPLKWIDCADIWKPEEPWTASSTYLAVPRARTIKLRIGALCRDDPSPTDTYFGAEDVRRGPQVVVTLRKNSVSEQNLLVNNATSYTLNGFFIQPSIDAAGKLAAALGLRNKDTSLKAKEGKRVVFACSSNIMHVLGPDRGSLTFSSQASMALQWLIVIRLTVQRDWSWDGFPLEAFTVTRGDQSVVSFSPSQNANEAAIGGPAPDRSGTDIIIVDVVNPKPAPGEFPKELNLRYKVSTKYQGQTSIIDLPPLDLHITLPVTTTPLQIPQLASVGLAMSPYTPSPGYTSTSPRTKMLWLEFASAPLDPLDRYFCRVLKYAPDPLLLGGQYFDTSPSETPEPEIPLDAELIRRIVPDQTPDTAGLDAMQALLPTSSPLHWCLPLPPGLTSSSLELLGFWTYEFRVGHWNEPVTGANPSPTRWSTAQGRFGPPLRTTGVQHPAPPLLCSVSRDAATVRVSARVAQPVRDGRILTLKVPATQVWFLLYAQAAQMDGSGQRRNLLIARTRGTTDGGKADAKAVFYRDSFMGRLSQYGLRHNVGLSVMAVEVLPQLDGVTDPLGGDLGRVRVLRASELVVVGGLC